jgi:hypothetical protein
VSWISSLDLRSKFKRPAHGEQERSKYGIRQTGYIMPTRFLQWRTTLRLRGIKQRDLINLL